jgi:LmbE family N-acetylglucosaminyl deacetylase
MSFLKWKLAACLALICCGSLTAQQAERAQKIHPPDERYKVDILVVVAHPDDEGAATPYLARVIYDLHKRVAVVYGTRGGSGANEESREHGPALAVAREIEAREACAKLGIRETC